MPHDDPTWSAPPPSQPSPSQPWPPREPDAQATDPPSRLLPPLPPGQPGQARPARGRRFWWLAALAVIVVAGVAVAVAVWPRADTAPRAAGSTATTGSTTATGTTSSTGATASGSPRRSATAPLTAVDRTVRTAVVGDCIDVRDGLDDAVPQTAAVTACTDPAATFSVVGLNGKSGADRPCRGDSVLRSTNVDRVLCLQRVYQAGQCVLGNGAQPFLASAVGCGETPAAPFTQLFKIDAVSPPGVAAVCTPPAMVVATSGRGLCLRQVR